ncbi:MAG: MFS transporter [Nakamurella sp.]
MFMTTARTAPSTDPGVRRWTLGVFAIFFVCGITVASWMARLPRVRDLLGATTLQMGLLIGGLSIGSIAGLLLSSHVIAALGARRTMGTGGTVMLLGMLVAGLGTIVPAYWLILLGLIVFGVGMSSSDVAMNLSGAANERRAGRTIMPLFHAFFSFGTMAGAGIGALMERIHLPVAWHLGLIVLVGFGALVWALPRIQDERGTLEATEDAEPEQGWRERLSVWKQPTTLLIGLIVLGMAFAEGSAGDWLALAMVDERGTTNATGAVVFGIFVTAMTVGRIAGVKVLDRFGRVPVLRVSALMGVIGLSMVIFIDSVPVAIVGTVLWGLGASLGFPVGMSAAADDPRQAAARVSAVATIGYLAFLVGPPGIGLLGEHVGLLGALVVVLVLIAVAAVVAPAARERQPLGSADRDTPGAPAKLP